MLVELGKYQPCIPTLVPSLKGESKIWHKFVRLLTPGWVWRVPWSILSSNLLLFLSVEMSSSILSKN